MNEQEREAKFRELAVKKVVYHLPDMERASVRRDEAYRMTDEGPLMMDIYSPQDMKNGERVPVVVVALGYPDPKGFYRQMGWAVSWAQLIAASGRAAVIYGTRDPADDIHAVLRHIRNNAAEFGIDENRIGILAASANVVVALSALMQDHAIHAPPCFAGSRWTSMARRSSRTRRRNMGSSMGALESRWMIFPQMCRCLSFELAVNISLA